MPSISNVYLVSRCQPMGMSSVIFNLWQCGCDSASYNINDMIHTSYVHALKAHLNKHFEFIIFLSPSLHTYKRPFRLCTVQHICAMFYLSHQTVSIHYKDIVHTHRSMLTLKRLSALAWFDAKSEQAFFNFSPVLSVN